MMNDNGWPDPARPGVPLPPLVSVPVLPEVAAAKALRRSLDHQQVHSLYARAVAAVEAARILVVEAGNIATAEAAAPGRDGHYYAALADVLDDLDMALLHAVEALASEDALWDRAADAEGAP